MEVPSAVLVAVAWYGLMSLVSFAMYWGDKRAATRGGWRVRESTLLSADLLGGWPGGWLARCTLGHKRRKASYRLRFTAIVALHVAAWGVAAWLVGRDAGWW